MALKNLYDETVLVKPNDAAGIYLGKKPTTEIKDEEVPKTELEVPKNYYGTYTPASFKPSETYNQAMAYTQSLLDKLNSGRTSYTDQINALMNQINNREKFNYDFNTDPLFQSQLQSNTEAGRMAMQDTMGQAAALTGGYGSTYAQAVGNQAYNQYIQDAYSNLGDYYGMALDKYNSEGQDLYNQFGMYSQADQLEYDRLANAYQLNAANAANLYDQEYNNYWQAQQMAQDASQFNANMKYKQDQLALENQRYQDEWNRDEARYQQEFDFEKQKYEDSKNAANYENYQQALEDDYKKRKDSLPSDSTIQKTALGYAEKQGIEGASAYLENLINTYGGDVFSQDDAYAILDYIASQTENKWAVIANNSKKDKENNKYMNQYGQEISYQQALDLGIIKKNGKLK